MTKSKFHAFAAFLTYLGVFAFLLVIAIEADGPWINEWGYIQKVAVILGLLMSSHLAIHSGAKFVNLVAAEGAPTDDEIDRVTRNPRIPGVE